MNRWELWLKGMIAAGIAGAANGVMTGFAAVGIDPSHFNLQSGFHNTIAIACRQRGNEQHHRGRRIFETVAVAR